MPLEVIGAGSPRTGTASLKVALEQLGFGPCHHMGECFAHPEQFALWERVFEEKEPVDWEVVLKGYRSACDAPSVIVYRELAERYPKAKVILTTRDPESWWRSTQATVTQASAHAAQVGPENPVVKMMIKLTEYRARRGIGRPMEHDAAIADFRRHNEEVRRVIAPERLLVFEAKQGWAPLCKFLNVPVPDAPFPHANTTEQFQAGMRERLAKGDNQ